MPESKTRKYIITELGITNDAPWTPKFTKEELTPMMFLDSKVIPGSFYVETAWMFPPFADKLHGEAQIHDFDEVLAFYGTDPQDPYNLHAEMEVPLGGETHFVNKSCLIYVPAGMSHGPVKFLKIDRPIFHFACGTGKNYF